MSHRLWFRLDDVLPLVIWRSILARWHVRRRLSGSHRFDISAMSLGTSGSFTRRDDEVLR
jgi:hypothetical protein